MRNFPYYHILLGGFLLLLTNLPSGAFAQNAAKIVQQKITKAQNYLAAEEIDSLYLVIRELKPLIKDNKSVAYGKTSYLLEEYWHAKEQWNKALKYANQAIPLLKQDTASQHMLGEAYLIAGYCSYELDDFDQTLLFYEDALKIREKIYGKNHLLVSNIYFNLAIIHQAKIDLLQSDKLFLQGLSVLKAIYPTENEEFADFYEELGYNQNAKGDFNEAIKYLDKALAIKTTFFGKNHPETAYTYEYLGRLYKSLENYEKAITFFNKALPITQKKEERDFSHEAMLHLIIGKSHIHKKDYDLAYQHFDKAITIDKNNDYIIPEINRLKGVVESERKQNDLAWQFFDNSLKGFQKNKKKNAEHIVVTQKSIVEYLIRVKDYQKALVHLDKAIFLGKTCFKDIPNEFFDLFKNKGTCYLNLKDFAQANYFFDKAHKINGGSLSPTDANLIQLKNQVVLNLAYANLQTHHLNPNYSLELLHKTDSLLSETVELIHYITRNYQERSTKENFIEQSYGVFRKAIEVKYQLYDATKDQGHLSAVFTLSEKSKNLILLETLNNIEAFELAGIPNSILDKENQLKSTITYLENKRFELRQQKGIGQKTIRGLNNDLFDLKQQYENLLVTLEKDYPQYYQLKFEAKTIGIEKIQQTIITDNQSIIEYFIADSLLYVFLIKKEEFEVIRLPKSQNLTHKINQFRKSIYSYRPFDQNKLPINNDSIIAISAHLGVDLYQELFAPFENKLTDKITIIADGALGYLPFDALLKQLPEQKNEFRTYDYLMNDHLISYAYSVNWWNDLLDKTPTRFEQNFVGIAPIFEETGLTPMDDFRGNLGPLKYNREEVKNIKNNIGGQVILGIDATRKQFLAHIQSGKVLHLATHGKANDEQGEYSFLAFAASKDSTDNRFLYVKDLFNLKIPADLVVLSACETGLGEIKRGEGIVGIGKGFSYAGVKSLVTTLWRVSDNSTATFMPFFYENLKKGMSKDEALWTAKKSFIKKQRHAGHPFFWSGYVAYGDMQPLEFQQNYYSYYIGGGFLLLIGLLFWKFRSFIG